jgi:hypothetical protein
VRDPSSQPFAVLDPGQGGGSQTLVIRREADRYEVFREQWKPGELPPTLDSESPPPDLRQRSVLERDRVAAKSYQAAIFQQGIPLTAFAVEDIQKEYERMKKRGVVFKMEPTQAGPATVAVFDDTCGNLIQLVQT